MPEGDVADGGAVEVESPRSRYFRQQSMHAADLARKVFDVENPPGAGGGGGGGGGLRPSESVAKLKSLERVERSALASVVVLKMGFYILVWYAFSTCLMLYNKTRLADKLGKFPAPLLMNTVHFALQATLSKIIIFFQSKGLENAVEMGWKDYFMRVVPTALGTALDINLSNASLVFISVTFATMCKSASPIFLLLFAFAFRMKQFDQSKQSRGVVESGNSTWQRSKDKSPDVEVLSEQEGEAQATEEFKLVEIVDPQEIAYNEGADEGDEVEFYGIDDAWN